jgi:hypothetical protein
MTRPELEALLTALIAAHFRLVAGDAVAAANGLATAIDLVTVAIEKSHLAESGNT